MLGIRAFCLGMKNMQMYANYHLLSPARVLLLRQLLGSEGFHMGVVGMPSKLSQSPLFPKLVLKFQDFLDRVQPQHLPLPSQL